MFGDRHCTFRMNFWDAGVGELLGVKIRFENDFSNYARNNLRFYISDVPIQEGSLMPTREELERYRIDPKRYEFVNGTNLFVINMGVEIGVFTVSGVTRKAKYLIPEGERNKREESEEK